MNLVINFIFILTNNNLSNYNINNDTTNENHHHVSHLIVSYNLNEIVLTIFGNITIISFLAILYFLFKRYAINVFVYGYTKWSMKILKNYNYLSHL